MHSMVASGGGKPLTMFVVVSIGSLSQEYARYALPRVTIKHEQLSVHTTKRTAPRDTLKVFPLSNINQHSSIYGV
jgi:hypothetical protein